MQTMELPLEVLTPLPDRSAAPKIAGARQQKQPFPLLRCDMEPAAVAAAFEASARAEAKAKYRRKMACKASREAAMAGQCGQLEVPSNQANATGSHVSESRMMDGQFVRSSAIRQRLEQMEEATACHGPPAMRQTARP
eukprot:TRINITY_DN27900_c0_g1_i1.p1 TRINITY_DN27900_c0_g1~~TRINITY_DN27900_c0_g1_i1.p1  ORF type:complete len:147 (-),score=30.12 TRINITY_DN27900_c0_g1_i1:150-563(-)